MLSPDQWKAWTSTSFYCNKLPCGQQVLFFAAALMEGPLPARAKFRWQLGQSQSFQAQRMNIDKIQASRPVSSYVSDCLKNLLIEMGKKSPTFTKCLLRSQLVVSKLHDNLIKLPLLMLDYCPFIKCHEKREKINIPRLNTFLATCQYK